MEIQNDIFHDVSGESKNLPIDYMELVERVLSGGYADPETRVIAVIQSYLGNGKMIKK